MLNLGAPGGAIVDPAGRRLKVRRAGGGYTLKAAVFNHVLNRVDVEVAPMSAEMAAVQEPQAEPSGVPSSSGADGVALQAPRPQEPDDREKAAIA